MDLSTPRSKRHAAHQNGLENAALDDGLPVAPGGHGDGRAWGHRAVVIVRRVLGAGAVDRDPLDARRACGSMLLPCA